MAVRLTMRILYVEDNTRFRSIVTEKFLSHHQVIYASTLAEARVQLRDSRFDAILLDHDLPDGKGTALMGEIKTAGLAGRVIAVAAEDENNERLLAAGAFAAASKMRFSEVCPLLEQLEASEPIIG